jgi:hypothetical protein
LRESGGKLLHVVVGSYGFALGDEVDCSLGAGLGGRVEVGAEELLEVGFGERFDVLDVAVNCQD